MCMCMCRLYLSLTGAAPRGSRDVDETDESPIRHHGQAAAHGLRSGQIVLRPRPKAVVLGGIRADRVRAIPCRGPVLRLARVVKVVARVIIPARVEVPARVQVKAATRRVLGGPAPGTRRVPMPAPAVSKVVALVHVVVVARRWYPAVLCVPPSLVELPNGHEDGDQHGRLGDDRGHIPAERISWWCSNRRAHQLVVFKPQDATAGGREGRAQGSEAAWQPR